MNTIETAIVITSILLIIVMSISIVFNEFNAVITYCEKLIKENKENNIYSSGNILRITKIISETGGELIDEVLERLKK